MRLKNIFLSLALTAAPVMAEIAIISESKPVAQSGKVILPENSFELAGFLQKGSKPALIVVCHDFTEACKALDPALEKFAAERAGKVDVVKVDPVRHAQFVSDMKLNLEQPVIMLYEDGKFVDAVVGTTTKPENIARFVDRALSNRQKNASNIRIQPAQKK